MNQIAMALSVLGIGVALLVLGLPDKKGEMRRYLRFHSAVVIYPPIVLAFIAVGIAMLVFSIIGK